MWDCYFYDCFVIYLPIYTLSHTSLLLPASGFDAPVAATTCFCSVVVTIEGNIDIILSSIVSVLRTRCSLNTTYGSISSSASAMFFLRISSYISLCCLILALPYLLYCIYIFTVLRFIFMLYHYTICIYIYGIYLMTSLSYVVTLNGWLYPSTYTWSPLYNLSTPYSVVALRPFRDIGNLILFRCSLIV